MIRKNMTRGVSAGALAVLASACGHLPIAEPAFDAMAAKRAGMTTNIADYGFQALFAATTSGRIDVAISSITCVRDTRLILYSSSLNNGWTNKKQGYYNLLQMM